MAARFEIQLSRLAEYPPTKQAELIAAAVKKGYGPVGASTRTGLSLAQLVAKVGPESQAGKLIQKEIAELAAKPVAELTAEQQAAIRALAKDAEGGGAGAAKRTLADPKVAAKLTGEVQELIRTWTQLGTKEARLGWCRQRTVALLKDAGIDVEIAVIDRDGRHRLGLVQLGRVADQVQQDDPRRQQRLGGDDQRDDEDDPARVAARRAVLADGPAAVRQGLEGGACDQNRARMTNWKAGAQRAGRWPRN